MKKIYRYVKIVVLLITVIFIASREASNTNNPYAPGEDNQLIIYTSHKKEVYEPIIKEFEERTGIWVQIKEGGTIELLEQIERLSGNAVCDVMFGGGVENLEAYSEYFTPYRCSESDMLDETFSSKKDSWTVFSALPIVIIYNNKLVYETSAPNGWEDILSNRWKGKMAFADPKTSGSSYTILATMVQVMGEEGLSTLERFANVVDRNILSGSGDVIDAVAKGTRLVGITLEETAMKRIAKGADITMVYPIEGTSAVPDGCAIIKNAPHEENAKLFLEFIVSEDVQQFIADQCYRRPIRKDIAALKEQASDIKIVDFNLEWASSNQNDLLERWSELIK